MYNAITAANIDGPGDNNPKPPIVQDENQKFGNWTGSTDPKVMAADLMKRGLVGANQLLYDNPDVSSKSGIINSQSNWKQAAMQNILANAKKFNLRTPEEINANRDALVGNAKWADAINNPSFKQIHPNWWQTITDSILPEQYAKYDAAKKGDIAKK